MCQIYCFRANCELSPNFHVGMLPDWLRWEANWQGYKISTVPEVASVAQVLGILSVEDSADGWIDYLESLGLNGISLACCEEFFEERGYY